MDLGLRGLVDAAGVYWAAVTTFAFVTMIAESAGPVVAPGESKPKAGAFRGISLLLSFFIPFLLFVHAYWAVVAPMLAPTDSIMVVVLQGLRSAVLIGLYILMLVLILAPSALGALVRAISRPAAKALYAAAPVLTILAFVGSLIVTNANVIAAVTRILDYYT